MALSHLHLPTLELAGSTPLVVMSFQRAGATRAPQRRGTRSWVSGLPLASTGNAALDRLLGGGVPLGSLVSLESDRFTNHADALSRLFLAEGVFCEHKCVLVASDGPQATAKLLRDLPDHSAGRDASMIAATSGAAGAGRAQGEDAIAEEEEGSGEEEEEADRSGAGLRIAWQYRKYLPGAGGAAATAAAAAGDGIRMGSGVGT